MDATARVIAETTFTAGGKQVPFPFALTYDPALIKSQNSYAVRAAIHLGESLTFTTDTGYPVITRDNPVDVELLLVRAGTTPPSKDTVGSNALIGTAWRLENLFGRGVLDNAEATLEFPEVGKVAGKGSCNRFFGSVTVSAQSIKFDRIGLTMMACPEQIMNQEKEYLRALEAAVRFEIKGEVLKIYTQGQESPMTFAKKAG
jgi:heat shock protein HslJ